MPTSFELLARLCQRLESTGSRNRKIEILADFLTSIDISEVIPSIRLFLGRPLPSTDARSLNVGYTIIEKVREGRQRILSDTEPDIQEVVSILRRIAEASGPGSQRIKENLLQNLFGRLSKTGRDHLRRILYKELRIGVGEGVLLEAIAFASGRTLDEIWGANMVSGDLAEMAEGAMRGRLPLLPRIFTPIRSMLAETADSVKEAIDRLGRAAFEHKLDGIRVQIHKLGPEVRVFSRRLADITDSVPEVREIMDRVEADGLVVDGEVIAFTDRPLPFQDLMSRFDRVNEREEAMRTVPVRLFLFDLLIMDEKSVMEHTYEDRWALLESIAPHLLVERVLTADPEEAGRFMEETLSHGHEGVMAKDPNSPYIAGKRGGKWLKIKHSHTLDLVIVAAEWGHGRRRGWLSDYHLAAVSKDGYSIVGKTFKDLTDDQFRTMTERLLALKIGDLEYGIAVRPEVVVEVSFNELQTSPKYPSGMALRFARIKSIRDDKGPKEADMLETLRTIYEKQFVNKSKLDI